MILVEDDNKVVNCSEGTEIPSYRQLTAARKSSITIENSCKLCSQKIKGGYIYWMYDLSTLNQMNEEMKNLGQQLSEQGEILYAEQRLKKGKKQTLLKNSIYEKLFLKSVDKFKKVRLLVKESESHKDLHKMIQACTIMSYLLFRGELELIKTQEAMVDLEVFLNYIKKLLLKLEHCNIICDLNINGSGIVPVDSVNLLYKRMGDSIIDSLETLSSVKIDISDAGDALELKISLLELNGNNRVLSFMMGKVDNI